MNVLCIPTGEIRSAWKQIKPLLEPAIERSGGRWTPEYVLASLVLGEQTLWAVIDKNLLIGAATVQLSDYPERKVLTIHFLGGEKFDEWYEDLLATLSEYGRKNMCTGIECNARKGFWKWFKADGFTQPAVFYEKDI